MSEVVVEEGEMAHLLVSALNLEEIDADTIDPDAPLFGSDEGSLGLDSIDALEIALAIEQKYGVELQASEESTQKAFHCLRALCAHVQGLIAK